MISRSLAPGHSAWMGRWDKSLDKLKEEHDQISLQQRYYAGDHWKGIATTYDQVTINYIATVVDIFRDSVYFKNPAFKFSGPEGVSDLLNLIFPQLLKKIKYKAMTKKILLEALIVGFGYRSWGYNFDGLQENDAISKDEIFGIYTPWDDVTWDPDAHGPWDADYSFMRQYIPLNVIKKNDKLDIPPDLEPSFTPKFTDNMTQSQITDQSKVELINVYDRGTGRHRMMIPGVNKWVYSGEWPLGSLNMFPINMLKLNDDKLYCTGPTKKLIHLNQVINKTESMRINHLKTFGRGYQVSDDISPQAEAALKSGYDGYICKTADDIEIKPIQDLPMDPAAYPVAESMFHFFKLLSRIGEYQSGVMPRGEATATEASYVQQGSSLGISSLQDSLGDFAEKDAEIAVALMKENYDTTRYVYDDVKKELRYYNKELLKGYTEVSVDIISAAPPDAMRKKAESRELLELFRDDQQVDQTKLKTSALEPYEIVDDPKNWLKSQEQMAEEQSELNAENTGVNPNV